MEHTCIPQQLLHSTAILVAMCIILLNRLLMHRQCANCMNYVRKESGLLQYILYLCLNIIREWSPLVLLQYYACVW